MDSERAPLRGPHEIMGALLALPVEDAAARIVEEGLALDGSDNAAVVVAGWR